LFVGLQIKCTFKPLNLVSAVDVKRHPPSITKPLSEIVDSGFVFWKLIVHKKTFELQMITSLSFESDL